MRTLPYFQAIQRPNFPAGVRTSPAPVRDYAGIAGNIDAPEPQRQPGETVGSAESFIPASPVTGVVYSLSEEARAALQKAAVAAPEARTAGVVKSGQYGFYRLDGKAGETRPYARGGKLDLLS